MGKMGARICLFLKWENGIYSLELEFTIRKIVINENDFEKNS